jgi:hypothetical protein
MENVSNNVDIFSDFFFGLENLGNSGTGSLLAASFAVLDFWPVAENGGKTTPMELFVQGESTWDNVIRRWLDDDKSTAD